MKIINSKILILLLVVLVSFSQSCLIKNISSQPQEEAMILMSFTNDQQAVTKFVQQFMATKPQAKMKEMVDRGFLFKTVRFNIFLNGDPQKNDLEIEVKITDEKSGKEALFNTYKYFERCPKTNSEELLELMAEITYQLLKASVISPFGTPI